MNLQEHLTFSFKEVVGQFKDDLKHHSQDRQQINSELVAMHRDVNKLVPQSKDISLMRNSVCTCRYNHSLFCNGVCQK